MFDAVPRPVRGTRPSADWGRAVADACNAASRGASSGMLLRGGPLGAGAEPLPANMRRLGGGGASAPRPWTFSCSLVDDGEGGTEREGGWSNAVVQYGYGVWRLDGTGGGETGGPTIASLSVTAAGRHYLKANLATGEMEIVVAGASDARPADDYANSVVHVYLGTVAETVDSETGDVTAVVQTDGIYQMPVLYRYV